MIVPPALDDLPAPAAACVRILRPVAQGVPPTLSDLAAAPCGSDLRPSVRYDPNLRAVRTTRDLAAGEVIAAPPTASIVAVRPGQMAIVRATVGPVTVERRVEVVQAARAGQPAFVRGADGSVFAAKVAEVLP